MRTGPKAIFRLRKSNRIYDQLEITTSADGKAEQGSGNDDSGRLASALTAEDACTDVQAEQPPTSDAAIGDKMNGNEPSGVEEVEVKLEETEERQANTNLGGEMEVPGISDPSWDARSGEESTSSASELGPEMGDEADPATAEEQGGSQSEEHRVSENQLQVVRP